MGALKRSYENGSDGSTIEYFDETHVVVDMNKGRLLDFHGSKRVTYLNVAIGRDCFTVYMRISSDQIAWIEKLVVIFQNPNGNYLISGIPDNIEGVTYRSSPKAWMTAAMIVNCFPTQKLINL